jgi:hypothetical protein
MLTVFWSHVASLMFLLNVANVLINYSEWLLVGQGAGSDRGDQKVVFPLTQKEIEGLKSHVESDLYESLSPSVGSGWKLR